MTQIKDLEQSNNGVPFHVEFRVARWLVTGCPSEIELSFSYESGEPIEDMEIVFHCDAIQGGVSNLRLKPPLKAGTFGRIERIAFCPGHPGVYPNGVVHFFWDNGECGIRGAVPVSIPVAAKPTSLTHLHIGDKAFWGVVVEGDLKLPTSQNLTDMLAHHFDEAKWQLLGVTWAEDPSQTDILRKMIWLFTKQSAQIRYGFFVLIAIGLWFLWLLISWVVGILIHIVSWVSTTLVDLVSNLWRSTSQSYSNLPEGGAIPEFAAWRTNDSWVAAWAVVAVILLGIVDNVVLRDTDEEDEGCATLLMRILLFCPLALGYIWMFAPMGKHFIQVTSLVYLATIVCLTIFRRLMGLWWPVGVLLVTGLLLILKSRL